MINNFFFSIVITTEIIDMPLDYVHYVRKERKNGNKVSAQLINKHFFLKFENNIRLS